MKWKIVKTFIKQIYPKFLSGSSLMYCAIYVKIYVYQKAGIHDSPPLKAPLVLERACFAVIPFGASLFSYSANAVPERKIT